MVFIFFGLSNYNSNNSLKDFFIGNRELPWYLSMFSIVATETSVLTFISVPGLAYRGDWTFLQLPIGYILGRVIVAQVLLPLYYNEGVISIYEVVGNKFGQKMQKLSSGLFLVTRVLADGIRFLATAVIIQAITSWDIHFSVLLIGICTIIYSFSGGIKSIIWIDALQFIIYFFSGLIVIFIVLNKFNYQNIFNILAQENKTTIFDFSGNPFFHSMNFVSAILGGAIFSIASHGTDYMMVQRCLACPDLKSAKKAMIGSGFFVFVQFFIFLFAGSLIYVFYNGMQIQKDREFSQFIIDSVPIGLKGVILAGVISAAMSTLSSSINSLSSTVAIDWLKTKSNQLFKIRSLTIFWGIVLMLIAIVFDEGDEAIVLVGFKIASYTYGGLLMLFLATKITFIRNSKILLTAFITSLASVFIFDQLKISWTWLVFLSTIVGLTVSIVFETFIKKNE